MVEVWYYKYQTFWFILTLAYINTRKVSIKKLTDILTYLLEEYVFSPFPGMFSATFMVRLPTTQIKKKINMHSIYPISFYKSN